MDAKFAKISPFQVDPDKIPPLTDEDFAPAAENEKEAMVEKHKSVSYWRDAWRRFRANTVSMVALGIFILCLLFAFVGPLLIPYGYGDQYRASQKLAPMEFSKGEEKIASITGNCDAFFATALRPGSITALSKGDYYINYKGTTYAFTLTKALEKSVIVLDLDAEDPLVIVKESDIKDGTWKKSTPIEFTDTPAEEAAEIKLVTRVFPHVFGTDSAGRDLMARTMYGTRVSIIIGIVAALIVLIIGSIYGAVSGLAGGAVDFVMMRIVELIYSIPEVLIVLLLQVVLKDPLQAWFDSGTSAFAKAMGDLGSGIVSIFITFALLFWVTMARIVRGQVLMLKQQEYVTAATALGANNGRIIRRHLLPNCVGQLVITTCLQIPSAIFLESFLSFLGLGVSAPMASLGSLCSDAIETLSIYPYRLIFPGIILTIVVLTLNLVGDGLRDALDPRLKR
ncbi:MAG: ABC transporter permease [Oscillospiraceae bacterium]|jgi:ABC-type dipeptide/oligopeptide/nickel transport system permease subunit|nr:ABC transporter permease [Oscillospiraceae bacterium]